MLGTAIRTAQFSDLWREKWLHFDELVDDDDKTDETCVILPQQPYEIEEDRKSNHGRELGAAALAQMVRKYWSLTRRSGSFESVFPAA